MAERYSHETDETGEERRQRPGPLGMLRNGGRLPKDDEDTQPRGRGRAA